jgi:transcriptional regulator with XRE-family HTH domain
VNTFGSRLKELRNDINATGEELGKVFHVTKVAVSNWENGNRFPDEDMLNKISDYFDITLDYLLGRTDIKTAMVVNDRVDGEDIELHVEKAIYPNGLTHNEVLKILEKVQRLQDAGFDLIPKEEKEKP